MLLKIAELFACCRMLQHNLPSEPLLQASFVVLRSSYGKLAPQSNNIPLAAIGSDIKMWYDVNCTTRDPVERCFLRKDESICQNVVRWLGTVVHKVVQVVFES
jgi:hypothetical protein